MYVRCARPADLRTRYAHIGRRRAKPGLNFLEALALGFMILAAGLASA